MMSSGELTNVTRFAQIGLRDQIDIDRTCLSCGRGWLQGPE